MIRFLNGPAQGSSLSLQRVPYFLRVVIDPAGQVDALDQLEDTVRDGETAHVYHKVGDTGRVILCSRGKGCRSEWTAEYRLYAEQPSQDVLRDNVAWHTWAMERAEEAHG